MVFEIHQGLVDVSPFKGLPSFKVDKWLGKYWSFSIYNGDSNEVLKRKDSVEPLATSSQFKIAKVSHIVCSCLIALEPEVWYLIMKFFLSIDEINKSDVEWNIT